MHSHTRRVIRLRRLRRHEDLLGRRILLLRRRHRKKHSMPSWPLPHQLVRPSAPSVRCPDPPALLLGPLQQQRVPLGLSSRPLPLWPPPLVPPLKLWSRNLNRTALPQVHPVPHLLQLGHPQPLRLRCPTPLVPYHARP